MGELPTVSALALAAALREDEALAAKIRAKVHRVSLSRFVHGHRKPGLETALFLEAVSGGRIPVPGWTTPGGSALLSRSTRKERSRR
jgi:hypothetical protein